MLKSISEKEKRVSTWNLTGNINIRSLMTIAVKSPNKQKKSIVDALIPRH
jgi:hypothetical protein